MASKRYAGSPKVFILLNALAAAAVFSGRSQGQPQAANSSSGASKIAVLDLVRVFNETAQIQDLNDMIRQKNDEYAKEATQRKKAIEDRQLELSAFKVGSPDHEAKRRNLIRMNIEANVWLKVSEQEIEQLRSDWTRIIYEKAMRVAGEMAKERGFDVVLQKSQWKPEDVEQNLQNLR